MDSLRHIAIDIDVRSLADFTVLKSSGIEGLSNDLKWLYSYFEPSIFRSMKPNEFVIISRRGSIGYGTFEEVDWHKKESENILDILDIHVEYSEV